jgi:multidrug resistance protein, MATE family
MKASSYVLLITSPVNVFLNYLFVYTFKFGLLGAPAATGITYWLSFLLLIGYAKYINGSQPWGGWSKRALRGWLIFVQLALMGILMVGTEWLAFEIITIMAGRLGTISLAAQSVIATTDQLLNTIPFGMGVASSNRIGNLLGSRKATRAATGANVAAWTSVIFGTIIMTVMLIARSHYGKLFSVCVSRYFIDTRTIKRLLISYRTSCRSLQPSRLPTVWQIPTADVSGAWEDSITVQLSI